MQLKQYLHIKIMKTFEIIEFPLTHFSETSFLKNDSFLCSVQADSYPPSQLVLNTLHTFFRFVLLYYLSFPCSNICLPYLTNFLKSLVLHCIADCHLSIYAQSHRPSYLRLVQLNQSQHCKMFSRMNVLKKTLSSAGVKMPKKYGNSATFLHGQLNINILSAENLPDLESTKLLEDFYRSRQFLMKLYFFFRLAI